MRRSPPSSPLATATFAIAAALALTIAGCTLTDAPASTRSHIIPLAVGNTWTYVDSIYHDDILDRIDSARTIITERKRVTVNGEPMNVYVSRGANPATGSEAATSHYLRNRPDGNHTVGVAREGIEFFQPVLHVRYPAENGARYPAWFLDLRAEGDSLVPVIDTLVIEVAVADTACVTPAGMFRCVEYRGWREDTVLHARAWYAPGIGYLGAETVREQHINGIETTVRRMRALRSYSLH